MKEPLLHGLRSNPCLAQLLIRQREKRQERDATSQGLAHRIHKEEVLGAGQDKATSRPTLVHNTLQVREEVRNTLRLVEDHLGAIA